MGERQAGEGIAELIRAGVLLKAARHGRMNLYLPAGTVENQRSAA